MTPEKPLAQRTSRGLLDVTEETTFSEFLEWLFSEDHMKLVKPLAEAPDPGPEDGTRAVREADDLPG